MWRESSVGHGAWATKGHVEDGEDDRTLGFPRLVSYTPLAIPERKRPRAMSSDKGQASLEKVSRPGKVVVSPLLKLSGARRALTRVAVQVPEQ